jgi:hypothetical protein
VVTPSTVTGVRNANGFPVGFSFGKTPLTIDGTGFAAVPVVTINGVACTSVVRVSSTQITCVAPALARGIYTVTVDTAALVGGYESFDPSSLPNGSATCVVWLNANFVTLVSGKVSAMLDISGNGNNATTTAGFEVPYNATDALFAGFPSLNSSNANGGGAVVFIDPLAAQTRSVVMVGMGDPTAGQNYWWNCGGAFQLGILPPPKNIAVDAAGVGTQLVWTNAVDGITALGVICATFDGTAASSLRVSAQTKKTGANGAIQNQLGVQFSVGKRGPSNTSQAVNGPWSDFLYYSGVISDADAIYLETRFGMMYPATIAA